MLCAVHGGCDISCMKCQRTWVGILSMIAWRCDSQSLLTSVKLKVNFYRAKYQPSDIIVNRHACRRREILIWTSLQGHKIM